MIPEDRQDIAALYVLGSLQAHETAEFESAMRNDSELAALVNDLRDSAAAMALTAPSRQPSPALKLRILREIAVEKTGGAGSSARSTSWLPWAIAAMFLIFSGVLLYDREQLRREIAEARNNDPLMQTKFVALGPANGAPADAKATVAWEPDKQTGVIRIVGMPAAGSGKDYQLWAVDENYKNPVSAGIVRVDPSGVAQVRFKPDAPTKRVKAFALTLEREGGVPKAEGPILLVGNT